MMHQDDDNILPFRGQHEPNAHPTRGNRIGRIDLGRNIAAGYLSVYGFPPSEFGIPTVSLSVGEWSDDLLLTPEQAEEIAGYLKQAAEKARGS